MNTNLQGEPGSNPVQRLRGIATVNLWADDLEAAKRWYTEVLGLPPYFERPGYAEFRVGDYQQELGLIDRRYAPEGFASSPGGAVVYWHVTDIEATFEWLQSLGARPLQGPQHRGAGFVTATVIDPFGNVLGVMYNPHYVDVLR
ncbi:VOC family protein [Deinococcus aetherius]|nr:VOC family protein [Deinococcus aetherius]